MLKNHHLRNLEEPKADDTNKEPIYRSLEWYPNELAIHLNLTRQNVRKNEELKTLKQFFIDQTESGNINRQEAVSMIPPLLLDIKSHHKILDMCAAPGSKTSQLVELLHLNCENDLFPGTSLFLKLTDLLFYSYELLFLF